MPLLFSDLKSGEKKKSVAEYWDAGTQWAVRICDKVEQCYISSILKIPTKIILDWLNKIHKPGTPNAKTSLMWIYFFLLLDESKKTKELSSLFYDSSDMAVKHRGNLSLSF